jgi:uncharacterized integral membrane protein
MSTNWLTLEKNRGYVIAGIGGIVGFIAFFLPYYTVSYLGFGGSISGSSVSWMWLAELATILVIAVSALLIFRNNAFGLRNMPVEKQVTYGRYAIIGGAVLALLLHILFAIDAGSVSGYNFSGTGISAGLGFGFFVAIVAIIAMIVGGVLALRSPVPAYAATSYQQPQYPQTQYPPYQQSYPAPDQQQPQYPPYQGQYPQQGYQQQPPQQGYAQPQQPQYPQQYPPQYPQQPQQPPQNPPQQSQW